ncbi:MAG: FAD binding domain-containing protein [Planctomycetota bacterium]|jgi:xanthine dehydrogenase iron-sulfur cluster and FAD-binding subunit A
MFNFKSYTKAGSIQEAIQLLRRNPEAHLIAGGTDILVKLHKGKAQFPYLVDWSNCIRAKHSSLIWSIFMTSPNSTLSTAIMMTIWSSGRWPALRMWLNRH